MVPELHSTTAAPWLGIRVEQPLGLQPAQRLAHRSAADAGGVRDFLLGDADARGVDALQGALAYEVVGLLDRFCRLHRRPLQRRIFYARRNGIVYNPRRADGQDSGNSRSRPTRRLAERAAAPGRARQGGTDRKAGRRRLAPHRSGELRQPEARAADGGRRRIAGCPAAGGRASAMSASSSIARVSIARWPRAATKWAWPSSPATLSTNAIRARRPMSRSPNGWKSRMPRARPGFARRSPYQPHSVVPSKVKCLSSA